MSRKNVVIIGVILVVLGIVFYYIYTNPPSTSGNTGNGSTGGSTGGNTGGNTGGSTGGNTGGSTGGSTSDASYTLRENYCGPPINSLSIASGNYIDNNLTGAQLEDRCKDICTAMGTGCRWFNYTKGSLVGGCLFSALNIADVTCSSSTEPTTAVEKTYIKN
jgi:hypothetical protein